MKNIYKSLAALQQEVGAIGKDSKGYGYTYASLDNIVEVITPLLKKHGLGFTQPLDGNSIKTILFHTKSGESIESTLEIPQGVELKGMNQFQVLGSAITYLRRYSLASVLGLVTDEDTDAAGEQTSYKASTSSPASDKQLNLIRTLASNQGMSSKLIEARIAEIKTAAQASEAIGKLRA